MEINCAKPGDFCWFELATTDQAAAKGFYGALFGWTTNDNPMGPDCYYTIFQLRGRNVGAAYTLMPEQLSQGLPPHWGAYVAVANTDESVAKAQSLGGELVVGPLDVDEHGRMAVLRDPTGAVINLWQAKQEQGIGIWGEVGSFCWSELMTWDTEAATRFYTGLFGWHPKVSEGAGFPYTHWQNGGADVGGMIGIMKEWGPVPPHWGNYVKVANCDDAVAKAAILGGKVCMPPTEIPNTGRFAKLQDPQGTVFAVFEEGSLDKG